MVGVVTQLKGARLYYNLTYDHSKMTRDDLKAKHDDLEWPRAIRSDKYLDDFFDKYLDSLLQPLAFV